MRILPIAVAVAVVATAQPIASIQLGRAIFSCGAWCEAADSAQNELVGLAIRINNTDQEGCEVPEALLAAEAEGVLRQFGFVVRSRSGLINGGAVDVSTVALSSDARCAVAFQMMFSITRWTAGGENRDPYYAQIIVDQTQRVMLHPASSHTDVLRSAVNRQMTVWANELARSLDGENDVSLPRRDE